MTVLIFAVMAALLIGAVGVGLWWGQTRKGKPVAGRDDHKQVRKSS